MNHLKSMTQPEIQALLKKLNQPTFRAKQLFTWLHKGVRSYDEMTNEERNALLKEILKKIEYKKEANGQIEIDLYPRLPKI